VPSLACVQSNVFFGKPDWNAEAAETKLAELAHDKVQLAIFPEAYLTGYCVDSCEEARSVAIPTEHEALQRLQRASDRLGIATIVGFAEDDHGDLYNTAVLFEPGVDPRYYRKSHLPELGLDKFVGRGGELPVFDTKLGRIGILICFDQRMPEPARVLALKGAELIALPTNWPVGAESSAGFICHARAAENRVFYATCNRVGKENGFEFIGLSKIVDPVGKALASAGAEEEIIRAEIDFAEARIKRTRQIPGKYETTVFACRRAELYGDLLDESLNVEELSED
jgi:predicted amidohydrolase